MTDFHVDLNALYDAAAAWSDASRELSEAANMAKDVPAGQDAVNWAMFQKSWSAQVEVAPVHAGSVCGGEYGSRCDRRCSASRCDGVSRAGFAIR